jgi:N4-gp56 family major capsid protein
MSYPSNSNTNTNSELFANLVTQAQFAAYEQSVARQLVTVFDAPVNSGKVLQVPIWSSITAENITDEAAATGKTTNTTSATITLSEHVVYHQVTDMLRDSAYSDVFSQIGDQSGRAIAESMDTQVFAQFSNLSGNTTAIASLTVDNIFDRVATLRANKLTGPFYAVVHPAAAVKLKKALTATTSYQNSTQIASDVLGGFYIGTIAGCQIFESALVPVASTTATCAVFHPMALGHAMRGGIDMNTLYLPAARATDVVLKSVAGAATLQSGFGVIMNTTI